MKSAHPDRAVHDESPLNQEMARTAELLGSRSAEDDGGFIDKLGEIFALGAQALRTEAGQALIRERRENRIDASEFRNRLAILINDLERH